VGAPEEQDEGGVKWPKPWRWGWRWWVAIFVRASIFAAGIYALFPFFADHFARGMFGIVCIIAYTASDRIQNILKNWP
jgi:hypothetical protein